MIVDDILALIREYKVLAEWSDEQIKCEIMKCFLDESIAYIPDSDTGKPKGIVLARWHDSCSIHVTCIAGYKGSLREFLVHMKAKYPQIRRITAHRHGKPKEYCIA